MASEQQQTEQQDQQKDERPMTEKPEVKDEHKEKAEDMRKEYMEDRPTVIMPGSSGTVAGTAVNEWLDDDGGPKFGDASESAADTSEGDDVDRGKSDDKSYGDTVAEDKKRNDRIRKAHDEGQTNRAQNDQADDGGTKGDEPQKAN